MGGVWSYGDNSLRVFGFDGTSLDEFPVAPQDDGPAAIAVHSDTGNVWLGVGRLLHQFDEAGEELMTIALGRDIRALAVDPGDSLLWVATSKTLAALDAESGDLAVEVGIARKDTIQDIAVDSSYGDVWVAMAGALRRYGPEGSLQFETKIRKLTKVASDDQGAAWIASQNKLLRVDSFGAIEFELTPLGRDPITALVADPIDASVWLTSNWELVHVDTAGEILHHLSFDFPGGIAETLALYLDLIAPEVVFASPTEGGPSQRQHARH